MEFTAGNISQKTLMNAVNRQMVDFINELNSMLSDCMADQARLYYAKRMTEDLGGAKIYLKREDLNHTGAHKINNVIGQMLLAKRMGKTRVIVTETGADSME